MDHTSRKMLDDYDTFSGMTQDGKPQGYGRTVRSDRIREGQHPLGCGYWRAIWSNGDIWEINKDDRYFKNVERDCFFVREKDGEDFFTGKKLWEDGKTYIGEMRWAGCPNGFGKMVMADGTVQEGEWDYGDFQN